MPKSCAECDFIVCDDEYEFECWCPIIRNNVEEYTADKPASCPLVEVPPHGRLIDVDKLLERIKRDLSTKCIYTDEEKAYQAAVEDAEFITECAPTVIESEDHEHEYETGSNG